MMVNNINFKQYCMALRCLCLLVVMAVVITVMPGNVSAESKITVISEEGVPAQFTAEIEKGAAYTEKYYKEKFGIDFENPVRIIITPSKEAYVEARIREGGQSRENAERHKIAGGNSFGSKHIILLNGGHEEMAINTEKRVKTTCHELTHQIQAQLSNNKQSKKGYMWLSEGTANSFAFRAMEMAGFTTVEIQRAKWLQELKEWPTLPTVGEVADNENWMPLREAKKNPYCLVTNMSEFLIEKTGSDKILDYFRYLSTNKRETAFQKAFGFSYDQYIEEFNVYYQREIPNAPK